MPCQTVLVSNRIKTDKGGLEKRRGWGAMGCPGDKYLLSSLSPFPQAILPSSTRTPSLIGRSERIGRSRVSQPWHYRHGGGVVLCCGGAVLCSRVLGSTPDLYPLDASNIPNCPPKSSPDIAECPQGVGSEAKSLLVEKHRTKAIWAWGRCPHQQPRSSPSPGENCACDWPLPESEGERLQRLSLSWALRGTRVA